MLSSGVNKGFGGRKARFWISCHCFWAFSRAAMVLLAAFVERENLIGGFHG